MNALTPAAINAGGTARDGRALRREGRVREIDQESRTIEVAFATETPVARWFGDEVLVINPTSIRLDRLRGGAAVLLNHDASDQVGVVESVTIGTDGAARATLRFGRTGRAADIFQDVVDGIRKHVSVGYMVHAVEVKARAGQSDLVRVTDWEPYEISLVAVPADPASGVGRNMNTRIQTMPDDNAQKAPDPVAAERERVRCLLDLGRQYGEPDMAQDMIRNGNSPDEMAAQLLAMRRNATTTTLGPGPVGMTERELGRFSILRLVRAMADPTRENMSAAGLELEAVRAAAQQVGASDRTILPQDVLADPHFGRRSMMAGTTGAGAELVATELLPGSFIDMLRARTVVLRAGVRVMTGLVGKLAIPRQTGGVTMEWLPEGGDVTDSTVSLDQLLLTPHTVAGAVPMTRRLLMQSTPDVETMIRVDLAQSFAREIEAAILGYRATDANAPDGLRPEIAAGALEWSTGDTPTFDEICELQTRVAENDSDAGSLAYIMSPRVAGNLRSTPIEAGNPAMIWQDGPDGMGRVAGQAAWQSSIVAPGEAFFGNWSDIVCGMWSGLDLRVDAATLAASDGLVVRGFQDLDVGVRHAASFELGIEGTP